jgi:hypothetical protein
MGSRPIPDNPLNNLLHPAMGKAQLGSNELFGFSGTICEFDLELELFSPNQLCPLQTNKSY